MATFLVAQQELADRLSMDQTVTAQATRLQRFLNISQQIISGRKDWTWRQQRQIIQTVVQKTAGTVAITAGSASVPGTSTAFSATDKYSYIQFQGSNDWFEITNVAAQTLTISPAFNGTTNLTATYTLRRVFYDLNNDVERVLDMRQFQTPLKLTNLGYGDIDLYEPDIENVAPPTAYTLFRLDPSLASTVATQRQVSFYPVPDAVYNIEVRYLKILADLSADADICQIPVPWHNVWITCAEWLGNKWLNEAGTEERVYKQFLNELARMEEEDSAFDDYHPVIQPSEPGRQSRFLPFPAAFQQP